ncbi:MULTISPECIES: hypothetical protein [unclassified Marinomonas]|uniref:hypothetical protein n=1 Tax=unclassified Marinomonas TaxID=196814 RepID=UPI000C1E843F|nr:hypothetical protein [Marinomonas sp. BSi20584]
MPDIIDEVLERKILERSDLYNEFLKPNGMHHGVNVFFLLGNGMLGGYRIWRSKDKLPFTERDIDISNQLKPYFVRFSAIRIF